MLVILLNESMQMGHFLFEMASLIGSVGEGSGTVVKSMGSFSVPLEMGAEFAPSRLDFDSPSSSLFTRSTTLANVGTAKRWCRECVRLVLSGSSESS